MYWLVMYLMFVHFVVNRPLPNGKLSKGTSPSQLLSTEDIHMLENMHCLASPRHFLRRKALIEDDIKGGLGLSSLSMSQVRIQPSL